MCIRDSRDNVDARNSTMNLTIHKVGQMDPIVTENNLVSVIADNGSSDTFDSVDPNDWVRGLKKNTLTGDYSGPKVAPHSEDISMAWNLCPHGCGPGEYVVHITLVEEGGMVPWKDGDNVWEREYSLVILQSSS